MVISQPSMVHEERPRKEGEYGEIGRRGVHAEARLQRDTLRRPKATQSF